MKKNKWNLLSQIYAVCMQLPSYLKTAKSLLIWVKRVKEQVPHLSDQLCPSESPTPIRPDISTTDADHLIALTLVFRLKAQGVQLCAPSHATLQRTIQSHQPWATAADGIAQPVYTQLMQPSTGIPAAGVDNPAAHTARKQPKDTLFQSLRARGETSHKLRRLKAFTTRHCITTGFPAGGGKIALKRQKKGKDGKEY